VHLLHLLLCCSERGVLQVVLHRGRVPLLLLVRWRASCTALQHRQQRAAAGLGSSGRRRRRLLC
jgi:hypothetical protein